MEHIVEAINAVLPPDSGTSGAAVYMRGFENYQRALMREHLARARQELRKSAPLLAVEGWTAE